MVKVQFKIGKGLLTCEAQSIKDIHKFSAVYGAFPSKCDACQSDDVYLSFKSPGGNDYYMVKCKKCGAELNLHQRKDDKGFYLKADEKMEVYVKDENKQEKKKEKAPDNTPVNDVDEDDGDDGERPF